MNKQLDELKLVVIDVCQRCLDGEPGECHTPGCIQWLRGEIDGEMGERLDFKNRYEYVEAYTARAVAEARRDLGVSNIKAAERIKRLQRRADWLLDRHSATSANLQFDKAEESALRWAIDILSAQLTPPNTQDQGEKEA